MLLPWNCYYSSISIYPISIFYRIFLPSWNLVQEQHTHLPYLMVNNLFPLFMSIYLIGGFSPPITNILRKSQYKYFFPSICSKIIFRKKCHFSYTDRKWTHVENLFYWYGMTEPGTCYNGFKDKVKTTNLYVVKPCWDELQMGQNCFFQKWEEVN